MFWCATYDLFFDILEIELFIINLNCWANSLAFTGFQQVQGISLKRNS